MASISASVELYDRMSAPLNSIMNALNMTISSMYDMQSTMASDMDTSSLDATREAANQAQAAIEALNQAASRQTSPQGGSTDVPEPSSDPVRIPVEWVTNDLDVFTGTGMDRFQQEVASTNQMLNTLSDTQNQIAQNAAGTEVFSDSALQDINSMGQRIQAVQQRIQQIENNPFNLGTDQANAELEQLRSQLNQAVDIQEALNQAVQNMDVEGANAAYNQLSQTIGNTERYIRDNANAQGQFNNEVQEGVDTSNQLVDTIKNLAAAYLTVQSLGKAIEISDELVQTTSRIDMMNDGLQSTDELMSMIYMSAQDARGSFDGMADVVARFGNNAKDAFSSSEEVVQFANIIQKQMTIAGAGTAEAQNAMLQLSQALGSGVLRGDELNSIFEQAPNLIQSIADYLDVPIGTIREMASEGELTADVVKAAIFASADEVNAKFAEMPMTWGQVWQSMQNTALIAFQPVLQRINDIANSDMFQGFVTSATNALAQVSMIILDIFNLITAVGTFVADHWSIIEPIVMGIVTALALYYGAMLLYNTVTGISTAITAAKSFAETVHAASLAMQTGATFAATAAQYGFNAALLACPVTWIIIAIIAVIALIFAICSAIAKMTGVANSGFGVITGGINVAIQFFKNLGLTVANIALGIGNALSAVASNMMTAFHNAICSVQAWFYGLLSDALTVIAGIAEALNKLPFVEFDYSGITNAADDYAAKAAEAEGNKEEYKSISDAFNEGMSTFDTFQDGWASDAFASGAAWGDGVADKVSGMFDGGMGDIDLTGGIDPSFLDSSNFAETAGNGISDTADNTGKLADSVDISNENLKYLRDMAETEAINRFTTAEIKVEMTNNNNVAGSMDIDGMVDSLSAGVLEAMEQAAEGVHD